MDIVVVFGERVRQAVRSRSKEVRLSIDEANELSTYISEILAIKVSEFCHAFDKTEKDDTLDSSSDFDGGSF